MYLLIIKDGLVTRCVGPYSSTQDASLDLNRVLASCSSRARWKIHSLESPNEIGFADKINESSMAFEMKAS